ncbi:MAG TPA: glycosyltransferase, partial [Planctomycetota bacterium]|nr:glycosyltransferase [Planctomycetota bacterium]
KQLRMLLRHIDRERFVSTVVASAADYPGYLDELRGFDADVRHLPMHAELSGPDDLAAMQALMAVLRRGRFDVVHLHGHKAALLGRPAARVTNARAVVYTPHGLRHLENRSPRLRGVHVRLERTFGSFTRAMICASQHETDTALRLRLLRPDRIHTVRDGVDFAELPEAAVNIDVRKSLGINVATRLITMVGKLEAPRDPGTLLRASRHVLVPQPRNHIVLVGDGDMIPFCRDLARQLDLSRQVICTGYRDDAIRIAWTSAIHVQSIREGGPGLSLLEGMAMGKPLIASDTPGHREVVEHGRTGVLVPPGDERVMSGALLKLIGDHDLSERLGSAARDYVTRHHTVERWVRGIEAVYVDVLRRSRKGGR